MNTAQFNKIPAVNRLVSYSRPDFRLILIELGTIQMLVQNKLWSGVANVQTATHSGRHRYKCAPPRRRVFIKRYSTLADLSFSDGRYIGRCACKNVFVNDLTVAFIHKPTQNKTRINHLSVAIFIFYTCFVAFASSTRNAFRSLYPRCRE